MARFLYTLLFYLVQPLVWLRLYWRSLKAPAYRSRMRERYGHYSHVEAPGEPVLWLHAVSVGETIAAIPLVRRLKADHPSLSIVMTTMTPTGADQVAKQLGDVVSHVYAPYDLPTAVSRFLDNFKPRALVIMETELWPNTIALCKDRGVPVVLANGRLSEKSARGYGRFQSLVGPMLANLDTACVQTEIEAARFRALGLGVEQTLVTGSIKFDVALTDSDRRKASAWRDQWCRQRRAWIAASTHEGEEAILLDAHRALLADDPTLLLILVPRHPERFRPVAALCQGQGFNSQCLSSDKPVDDTTEVLVGDTMGDLLGLFGVSDAAFVGGSLVPRGGHNLLEPALWGVPVLSGPHVFNFAEITRLLEASGGLRTVADAPALAQQLGLLLSDETLRREAGERALAVVEANRGALDQLEQVVVSRLRLS